MADIVGGSGGGMGGSTIGVNSQTTTPLVDNLNLQQLINQLVITDTTAPSSTSSSQHASNSLQSTSPSSNSSVGGLVQASPTQLAALETAEQFDQMSHVLRTIFKAGKQVSFIDQLTNFVNKKELEIEKMCNFHYQEFVQSVDQLLKMRVSAVELKSKISDLNTDLQSAGGRLIEKKRELMEHRRMMLNIETAIDKLQTCNSVLDIVSKIYQQIQNRKYYSALRMLEDLQNIQIRPIIEYEFAKLLQNCIPQIRENIREEVTREMKDWLVRVREQSRHVGELAIHECISRRQQQLERQRKEHGVNGGHGDDLKGNSMEWSEWVHGEDFDGGNSIAITTLIDEDHFKMDFRPLYQCLHIYDVLGRKAEFKSSFEEIRRVQGGLLVTNATFPSLDVDIHEQQQPQSPNSEEQVDLGEQLINNFVESLKRWLEEIAGFFAVESIIMEWTVDFRSRTAVDALWENIMGKVYEIVMYAIVDREDPDLFLKVKLAVLNFVDTMEGLHFQAPKIVEVLFTQLQMIVQIMQAQLCEKLSGTLLEDEYQAMTIENEMDLEYVTLVVGPTIMKSIEGGKLLKSFPRTLPFSKGFPTMCEFVKKYIQMFYAFSEGFQQQYQELDDLIKKSLENVLTLTVNEGLEEKLSETNMSQAVQIIINLEYLEQMCTELEEMLMLIQKRDRSRPQKVVLVSSAVFRENRKFGERRIFEMVNLKIDEFLDLSTYEWAAGVIHNKPSAFLQDMLNFITTVVTSTLANLPANMKGIIYVESFKHIGNMFHDVLTGAAVKKVTPQAIENVNLDLMFLEGFVKRLGDPNVTETLLELRQTIDLLRTDTPEEYLQPNIRSAKYSQIKLEDAIKCFEKIKMETGVFAKATEKKKKLTIENFLKSLKTIASSGGFQGATNIVANLVGNAENMSPMPSNN